MREAADENRALEGRAALVTGASSGLGRATAIALAQAGADVALVARSAEELESTQEEVSKTGRQALTLPTDLAKVDGAAWAVEQTVEALGRIDVLVNAAGTDVPGTVEELDVEGWDRTLSVNLRAPFLLSKAVFPSMREAGGGTIVNVTLSPHHGLTGMAHSSAARAAVEGYTRALAREWAADGVTVVAVAAGHFDTESLRKYPEVVWRAAARSVPLQRLGREIEHAWLVTLASSEMGHHLSGAVLTLDGARDNWFGPWPPPGLVEETGEVPTEARRAD